MAVTILIDPPKNVRPKGAIRADVGWKLYLPDDMGDIPKLGNQHLGAFRHWLWWELSTRLGYLRPESPETVYILTPPLSRAGLEFVVRTASFWTDEVHSVWPENGEYNTEYKGKNIWTAPIVNLNETHDRDSGLGKMHEEIESASHTFYSHFLGATRSFVRAYDIHSGGTYSRFHSHTAREELYVVLKGKGSARIGNHKVAIKEGDLISKPTGPDLSSQILADCGEDIRILDIEIWPDDERKSKDLIHYADHGELDFSGEGWDMISPYDTVQSAEDAMKNYETGYRRKADGSWEPREIPGYKKREK